MLEYSIKTFQDLFPSYPVAILKRTRIDGGSHRPLCLFSSEKQKVRHYSGYGRIVLSHFLLIEQGSTVPSLLNKVFNSMQTTTVLKESEISDKYFLIPLDLILTAGNHRSSFEEHEHKIACRLYLSVLAERCLLLPAVKILVTR